LDQGVVLRDRRRPLLPDFNLLAIGVVFFSSRVHLQALLYLLQDVLSDTFGARRQVLQDHEESGRCLCQGYLEASVVFVRASEDHEIEQLFDHLSQVLVVKTAILNFSQNVLELAESQPSHGGHRFEQGLVALSFEQLDDLNHDGDHLELEDSESLLVVRWSFDMVCDLQSVFNYLSERFLQLFREWGRQIEQKLSGEDLVSHDGQSDVHVVVSVVVQHHLQVFGQALDLQKLVDMF